MSGMADLPDVPQDRTPELRASNADRERVAEILRTAAAEGRIDLDELDERLGAVYAARTYADLVPLTRDLPVAAHPAPPMAVDNRIGGGPTPSRGAAVTGGVPPHGRGGGPAPVRGASLPGG